MRDSYSRLSGVQILHKEDDDDEEEIEEEVVVVDDEEDKSHATTSNWKIIFLSYLFVKGEYQVVHVEEESTSVPQVEEKIVELKEEE